MREVEVFSPYNDLKPGDHVVVRLEQSKGVHTLVLGYLLPFILMFVVLVISLEFSGSESLSGLLAIGILVPYYSLLFVFRENLKQKFTFTLKKTF